MSRRLLTGAAAVLFAAASTTVFADNQQSPTPTKGAEVQQDQQKQQNETQNQAQPGDQAGQKRTAQAPEGFVLIEEDVVYMTGNEPQLHLVRAHEDMEKGNPEAAAEELRIAAGYLRMQGSRPGSQGKADLRSDAGELWQLAKRVEDKQANADDVAKTFGRVNFNLAQEFQARAQAELQKGRYVHAGYDLRNAAESLTQAMVWSNAKPSDQETQAIAEARRASHELIAAHVWRHDEANGQSNQANAYHNGNATNNTQQPGEAQQAGARIEGNAQSNAKPEENTKAIQDAQKAAQDLGNTISQCSGKCNTPANNGSNNNSGSNSGNNNSGK